LHFPQIVEASDSIKGEIWFYYPADKFFDFKAKIELTGSFSQSFLLEKFSNGKYEIHINWRAGETDYYQKEIIFVQ
jgi:hypothetical protein